MATQELAREAANGDALQFWTDPLMWSCVAMVVIGHFARVFASSEPIVWRKLVAEAVLAAIGAVGIYAGADMQGMDTLEKIMVSVLMSLGGIHLMQRLLQAWTAIKGGAA